MTGTAELVADELEDFLTGMGITCDVMPMNEATREILDQSNVVLICTSTTGTGDVPDNGQGFLRMLRADKPDLGRIRFGICGLGDTTYKETFNFGGATFEAAFRDCGAEQIGTRMKHDASLDPPPEEMALEWCKDWLDAFPD